MLKTVIAVVLLAHGIGHSMGMLQMLKVATVNPSWNGDSWLLTGAVGTTVTQVVGVVLWVAAIVGFAALAASVMGWLPVAWFQPRSDHRFPGTLSPALPGTPRVERDSCGGLSSMAEHRIVAPKVTGSTPVGHPST